MMPVPLHPNEWLDGAVVISYFLGSRGLETFYHQNHPIVTELYRLHQAGELSFAGTVATAASNLEEELNRNSMMAARLAKMDPCRRRRNPNEIGRSPSSRIVRDRPPVRRTRYQDGGANQRRRSGQPRRVGSVVEFPGCRRHRHTQRWLRHHVARTGGGAGDSRQPGRGGPAVGPLGG